MKKLIAALAAVATFGVIGVGPASADYPPGQQVTTTINVTKVVASAANADPAVRVALANLANLLASSPALNPPTQTSAAVVKSNTVQQFNVALGVFASLANNPSVAKEVLAGTTTIKSISVVGVSLRIVWVSTVTTPSGRVVIAAKAKPKPQRIQTITKTLKPGQRKLSLKTKKLTKKGTYKAVTTYTLQEKLKSGKTKSVTLSSTSRFRVK